MMSKIGLASCLTLLACVLSGLLLWQGHGLIVGPEENQDDHTVEVGVWTDETRIEQSFIASSGNLSRIDIFFDSYYPWHSPYLEFRLLEIDTAETPPALSYTQIERVSREIRRARVNGWLISSHMYQSLAFEPIPDSQGKRYLLSLRSPALKEHGMFILMSSPDDSYDGGDLFINGEKQPSDLSFRALYQRPRWDVAQQYVTQLSLQKPFPFSQPATYYVLFIVYLAGIIALFLALIRGRLGP